ncbi:aminopeptidase P family protein [Fulvivirga sedimenti]|uniref:Xaa-Pro aminopeptidase n=1 Tax=Fulvivirga sedimenti TaxID=2879465 RepID=A0A9X1KVU6_9BACT|nr:aminopeptidase P family protein [Fulvivirga sedimenti]MCA6074060.1 aminopeptidase P N-terminal domain-containing protein [Fulvivirga sedimenti]
MRKIFILILVLSWGLSVSQDYPADQLDIEFHKKKRLEVINRMPSNSVAVIFSNPVRNRANDVEYIYHQDPDFYYLTGNPEPHSVLLLFSEPFQGTQEILFVQPHHARQELYNGPRLGVEGAKEKLGFKVAYENTEFKALQIPFQEFDSVLFFDFKNDVRDEIYASGDLYDLMNQFKAKAGIPQDYNSMIAGIYEEIRNLEPGEREAYKKRLAQMSEQIPLLQQNEIIQNFIKAEGSLEQEIVAGNILPSPNNFNTQKIQQIMTDLREIKEPQEIDLLRKAVYISCMGQVEVMKAMHPGMSETEIQGIQEYVFKKYGSEYEGYPSIVGAGHNGCVLHYIKNDKLKVGDELVLMDLGAEYHGYTADVTRTIPANGKFTPEQKAIYDLVYQAQEESFKICKPGETIRETTTISRQVIADGLIKLGIIADASEVGRYFPHGVSHHIGLDVHDRGNYTTFEKDMVLTVEPGIYIPENSPCDPKWWGIAVRIEDDVLITEDGYELLTAFAPRSTKEIEAMMAQPSIFDSYSLPPLEDALKD